MNAEPLVSAIIPTYNRASLVSAAIDSVRQQTYRSVEIIVVDDGSTDDTQARLRVYGDSVRVIRQDNAGPSAARNRGLAAARGDIVALLDSDDTWESTKLERQVRLLGRVGDSVTCCICNALMVFPDHHEISTFEYSRLYPPHDEGVWENVAEVLTTRFVLFSQTIAIRRQVIERIGGFDDTLRFHEDHEFPVRLALEGPWAYIRQPLVSWRQESPGSYAALARANQLRLAECGVQMWQSLYDRVGEDNTHEDLRKPFLRELKACRREVRAVHLSRKTNWTYSIVGRSILRADRYRRALFRRSPWYPKMKVSGIPDVVGSEVGK